MDRKAISTTAECPRTPATHRLLRAASGGSNKRTLQQMGTPSDGAQTRRWRIGHVLAMAFRVDVYYRPMPAVTIRVPDDLYEDLAARRVVLADVLLLALRTELQRHSALGAIMSPPPTKDTERGSTCSMGSIITPAELRVMTYLCTHLSLAEIAERLHISRSTVKSHVASLYAKLNVTSRSAAVESFEPLQVGESVERQRSSAGLSRDARSRSSRRLILCGARRTAALL